MRAFLPGRASEERQRSTKEGGKERLTDKLGDALLKFCTYPNLNCLKNFSFSDSYIPNTV